MRSLIRSRIVADAQLVTLGVLPTGVRAGQIDTPEERPFLNLIWGDTNEGLSVVKRRLLTVWVHDVPEDYSRIDAIVFRLRSVLTAIEGASWTENGGQSGWVTAIRWEGDSGDLADDGHGTIVRTSSYSIIGSGQ